MRTHRSLKGLALAVAVVLGLMVISACGGGGGGEASDTPEGGDSSAATDGITSSPLTIGTSLPLTGQLSALGGAVEQGYKAWQKVVNDSGGLLGRDVEVRILDDASNQNTVVSDYNTLIADKVDLLIGTFSTRLTLPALNLAERYEKLYVDPAGGAPEVFERNSPMYFYTEPSPSNLFGAAFATYISELPEGERPKTVAYVYAEDPFYESTIGGMRDIFDSAGIEAVAEVTFQGGEENFDAVANRVKQADPDVVVTGGGFGEEVGIVRSLAQSGFTPDILYQTNAPNLTQEYLEAVGEAQTEGVFSAAGYSPELETAGNTEFVAAFRELFDTDPGTLSAAGYAAGQVLQAAVTAVGEEGIENQALLADYLHANGVDTVLGPLEWDSAGIPSGTFAIGQWQSGTQEIVLPPELATTDQVLLCYATNC